MSATTTPSANPSTDASYPSTDRATTLGHATAITSTGTSTSSTSTPKTAASFSSSSTLNKPLVGTAMLRLQQKLTAALHSAARNPRHTDKQGNNEAARLVLFLQLKDEVVDATLRVQKKEIAEEMERARLEDEVQQASRAKTAQQSTLKTATDAGHAQPVLGGMRLESTFPEKSSSDGSTLVDKGLTPEEEMLTFFRWPTDVSRWF